MEPGTPLVVQSDGVQGQHTIVIRLMQEPSGANGQPQYMPISVHAIPLYPMAQQCQQLQKFAVDQQPPTRNPNYTTRTSQRQSRSRPVRQPVQAYCCECSTKDLPVPPGRDGGRSNGNRRCRQVCYKVEYMLCPEDAIYGQQPANPCSCNQFSDVRGSDQFCSDDQDSQAEQDFNYPMGNIPRRCKFQQCKTCQSERPPNPQEQEEKTMPNQSEELATKDDLSAQYNAPRSQENTDDNDDQKEPKTEDAYRRDQSTNTNTQECPTAPDLEYIKTICESLGHAMVACATAAVEAASKLPHNLGHGRSASNWVTRESSYFLEQTPDTTETYERPLISRSWVDTQPSIMTQHINPPLLIEPEEATTDAEAAAAVQINTAENILAENPEENSAEQSAYTLRSIQQQLEVQASEFGIRQPSAKGESKIAPDDFASLTQDTAKSTRSSVGSRKSARTPRVSTQSTRSSASAAKRKILSKKKSPRGSASAADEKKSPRGSVSASEQKCIERCSNQSAAAAANERKSSSASATKRRSSRSGSVAATNEKKSPRVSVNATDEKKSPRGSASATDEKSPRGSTSAKDKKKSPRVSVSDTERKSSSRDSIKSNKSSGIAAEQKSSPQGSATASERHCSSARCSVRSATASVADRKDSSPPGSIHSVRNAGNAAVQKTSPRESIRSGKSTASAKEQKDSPPGSIHSIRYAEEQKDSPRESIKSGKSTASAAERKDSPPGSIHSVRYAGEQKDSTRESIKSGKSTASAAERKDSPPGSIHSVRYAGEQKDSTRESIKSGKSTASAAERKESPPGSMHSTKSSGNAAEQKDSPRGSCSPRCSYQSALPLASAAEEKSSPPGSSHSMQSTASVVKQNDSPDVPASESEEKNSPSGSANAKERKIPSRAQALASKKVSSVGKLGGKRSPKSGPQGSQPLAKSNKRTTKEPNKRASSKEIAKKRRASSSSGKDNCKNKDAKWKPSTSSVQNRPILKPLKCCVPCKYINYCYCCPPKPSANNCRPWFC